MFDLLLDDTMPNPNQSLQNSFPHVDYPPSSFRTMPSSSHPPRPDTNSQLSPKKNLSCPQLMAVYREIINEWYNEKWLTFVDNHTDTYLTLDSNRIEFLTTQMAVDRHYLKSGRTSLISPPECLLIRTKSKAKTVFSPNFILSIENLCDNHIASGSFRYKLMAIICHSNETNSKIMFYKDFPTNSWYIYYDETNNLPSYSNVLSTEEHYEFESVIQRDNHVDSSDLLSPLSTLCNHPIVYVYIPEKN